MIYRKSDDVIEKLKAEQRFGAQLVKGIPLPVCEYYVTHKQRGNVDVWNLTTKDIVGYVIQHAKDDGFKLLDYCKPEQMIGDYATLQEILKLEEKHGHIIRDIVGATDRKHLYNDAQTIALYLKRVEGRDVSVSDVIKDYAQAEQNHKLEKQESVSK